MEKRTLAIKKWDQVVFQVKVEISLQMPLIAH